jgi:DNA-binding transcriptional LysR family regulator
VQRAFAAAGVTLPERLIQSDSLNFRLSLLQAGRHLTLMPDSTVLLAPPLPWLRVLPVTLPRWQLPVVVATLRHRLPTAAAALFIAEAHAVIREIAAQDPSMLPGKG